MRAGVLAKGARRSAPGSPWNKRPIGAEAQASRRSQVTSFGELRPGRFLARNGKRRRSRLVRPARREQRDPPPLMGRGGGRAVGGQAGRRRFRTETSLMGGPHGGSV